MPRRRWTRREIGEATSKQFSNSASGSGPLITVAAQDVPPAALAVGSIGPGTQRADGSRPYQHGQDRGRGRENWGWRSRVREGGPDPRDQGDGRRDDPPGRTQFSQGPSQAFPGQSGFVPGQGRQPYASPSLGGAESRGSVQAPLGASQHVAGAHYSQGEEISPPGPSPLREIHERHLLEEIGDLSISAPVAGPPAEGSGPSPLVRQPPPVSSRQCRAPQRPGQGHIGIKCIVRANHFSVEFPDIDIHHYDVAITPEVTSRGVNRAVMESLGNQYRHQELGSRLLPYDGRKSLYTAGPLPFREREFQINLADERDASNVPRRERTFKVVIKFAAQLDLYHLKQFLHGRQADAPQEVLQALDIVLRQSPTQLYCPVARSFYHRNLGGRQSLGNGLETWRGFYQSLRPTQRGLSLNIDTSSTAFIEPLPVIDFVSELLRRKVNLYPALNDKDRAEIKKALTGVKVEVTHRGEIRRKYRISGLTSRPTQELSFPVDDAGTLKTVTDYFFERYQYRIQTPSLPCLQIGNGDRPNYLPMEVCRIVEGQRYSKRLKECQKATLRKGTSQRPRDRENDILQIVRHNAYARDRYAREFGLRISDRLAEVEARILPAPRLKYSDAGTEKDCVPQLGKWNMNNKKMVNGGIVKYWAWINFAQDVCEQVARQFCVELAQMCQKSGITFKQEPVMHYMAREGQVEWALKHVFTKSKTQTGGKDLDLLAVILPDNNGPLYGELKRICETDLGVVSQCCLAKHVYRINTHYLANVALKINVKVGGTNTVLIDALTKSIPLVSDVPTIIFGADVTHHHPGEDSSPSIAAVVASQDWPQATKYAGLVSAQAHRQELIQDLYKSWVDPQRGPHAQSGGMIRELLLSFEEATHHRPERIIFYRDGVSEGQFEQVLFHEVDAIRKACESLWENYQPPVTFIVVQKRHHTRLFPSNHYDRRTTDDTGNVLPGTLVDSQICHPTEFDFYLCSHAGIKGSGTSRPAHYHVLCDENNFKADELQSLTNNLCYTYARCTRSVSIVPPAYYAHLLAFRARLYMDLDNGDAVRPLIPLKENVKKVMFYC